MVSAVGHRDRSVLSGATVAGVSGEPNTIVYGLLIIRLRNSAEDKTSG